VSLDSEPSVGDAYMAFFGSVAMAARREEAGGRERRLF